MSLLDYCSTVIHPIIQNYNLLVLHANMKVCSKVDALTCRRKQEYTSSKCPSERISFYPSNSNKNSDAVPAMCSWNYPVKPYYNLTLLLN